MLPLKMVRFLKWLMDLSVRLIEINVSCYSFGVVTSLFKYHNLGSFYCVTILTIFYYRIAILKRHPINGK